MDKDKLIRAVDVLYLIIKKSDGKCLREKWQQHTGKEKVSRFCPMAEKMFFGESNNIPDVVNRAIDEELRSLQIKPIFSTDIATLRQFNNENISASYPELTTRYNSYVVKVDANNLPETDFETVEYEKENPTKIRLITAWQWVEPISENFKTQPIKQYLRNL